MIIIIIVILIFCKHYHSPWSIIFTNRSRVRCPTAGRRSALKAAASTRARLTRLHFCSFPFHARFSRDTAPTRRDVDHWEFAKGRGHLSATRMSFIVQIFSLLYSYRYIVTLRNVDCDGDHLCVAVSLLYFLIFLLNKCEHAESINMCVFTLYVTIAAPFPGPTSRHLTLHLRDYALFCFVVETCEIRDFNFELCANK